MNKQTSHKNSAQILLSLVLILSLLISLALPIRAANPSKSKEDLSGTVSRKIDELSNKSFRETHGGILDLTFEFSKSLKENPEIGAYLALFKDLIVRINYATKLEDLENPSFQTGLSLAKDGISDNLSLQIHNVKKDLIIDFPGILPAPFILSDEAVQKMMEKSDLSKLGAGKFDPVAALAFQYKSFTLTKDLLKIFAKHSKAYGEERVVEEEVLDVSQNFKIQGASVESEEFPKMLVEMLTYLSNDELLMNAVEPYFRSGRAHFAGLSESEKDLTRTAPGKAITSETQSKSTDSKPNDSKAAETKPTETKATETKATETKAAETKATETKVAETKAAVTTAAETKSSGRKVISASKVTRGSDFAKPTNGEPAKDTNNGNKATAPTKTQPSNVCANQDLKTCIGNLIKDIEKNPRNYEYTLSLQIGRDRTGELKAFYLELDRDERSFEPIRLSLIHTQKDEDHGYAFYLKKGNYQEYSYELTASPDRKDSYKGKISLINTHGFLKNSLAGDYSSFSWGDPDYYRYPQGEFNLISEKVMLEPKLFAEKSDASKVTARPTSSDDDYSDIDSKATVRNKAAGAVKDTKETKATSSNGSTPTETRLKPKSASTTTTTTVTKTDQTQNSESKVTSERKVSSQSQVTKPVKKSETVSKPVGSSIPNKLKSKNKLRSEDKVILRSQFHFRAKLDGDRFYSGSLELTPDLKKAADVMTIHFEHWESDPNDLKFANEVPKKTIDLTDQRAIEETLSDPQVMVNFFRVLSDLGLLSKEVLSQIKP